VTCKFSGPSIEEPVDTPAGKLGLSICYDLRFPEMSLGLRARGAQLLTFPSAFTAATGQAHWEPLLRARAIETQSYVVAAAQTGCHGPGRNSHGHAMIVDPWGAVIAQCSEGAGFALAQVVYFVTENDRDFNSLHILISRLT
jgi:deaminated glutathione amidase